MKRASSAHNSCTVKCLKKRTDVGMFGESIQISTEVKFVYFGKATEFCEISTVDLSYVVHNGQIYGGDFAKFFGLFRIYELYKLQIKKQLQNNYNYLFPWWQ